MGSFLPISAAEKKRPLPETGTYEKSGPFCPDKLLRKKGPCQELERARTGVLLSDISCGGKKASARNWNVREMGSFLPIQVAEKKRPLPGTGTYEKWVLFVQISY